jgi:lipoate-protein ligase A
MLCRNRSAILSPIHKLLSQRTKACVSQLPLRNLRTKLYTTGMSKGDNVECFISTHTDPFVNLAIEDYLFKTTDPEKYILYLWRNKPCVVVGRNQNPFKECNLQYMEEHGIPLVRRRSGGGTVYHVSSNIS